MRPQLSDAEIAAIRERVEQAADDAEAAHRAYETLLINWRIRMADKARAVAEAQG